MSSSRATIAIAMNRVPRSGQNRSMQLRRSREGLGAMTITVHQRPIEATRTANKSCKWVAEAIVNGRTYVATSRMAPANDIARQLVADGVPDAPMHVYTAGLKGCLVWRSFYKAAGYTFKENAQTA